MYIRHSCKGHGKMSDQSSWVEDRRNWVERRNQCNIDNVCTELRETVESDVAKMNAILVEADDADSVNYTIVENAGVATGFAVAKRIDTVTTGGRIIFRVVDDKLEVEHWGSPRGPSEKLFSITCEWNHQENKCDLFYEHKLEVGLEGGDMGANEVVESVSQISEKALSKFFFD